jgi:hypothetical protein
MIKNIMEIKYHKSASGIRIAEIVPGGDLISGPEDILDIMADVRYNDCDRIIIHQNSFNTDFFDLKTGVAGEILQKFSNYRMKLAIIGNFSSIESRSLRNFIGESNKRGMICFVSSMAEALARLDHQ